MVAPVELGREGQLGSAAARRRRLDPHRRRLAGHLPPGPYPLVFGFEFENEGFHARVKDYESTFGNNAYSSCVASDDHCYCLESSPGFLSLFRDLLADSGGSCVGVAATSLLLARMDLDVHDAGLNSDAGASGIQFPAGFTRQPVAVHSQHDCEPAQPVNLRAMIRANHGVQFSLEAIEALLVQMDDAPPSISADPLAVLNRVENQLDSHIICLIPELGRGHAVTPYAVARGARADGTPDPDANVIRVYDSNYPEDTTRVIEVFAADADYPHGWYRFEFSDADTWEGDGLFTMPISLFREERNPPDVLDAVGFLWTMVAGAADGLYRDGKGGEVGWRTDGSVVDQYPGARALVPLGAPGSGTRHVPFVFPATNPPPAVQINVRSNHFAFRAANAGRFLQLERYDGVPGGTDQVSLQMDNGRLAGLQFTPQYQASDVTVRGALPPEAGQRLVFDWSAGTVPAGQTAAFTLLSGSGGFEFRNDTGAAVRPTLTLRFTESGSTNLGTRWFGPFDVPADAVQQVFLEDGPMGSQLRSEIDFYLQHFQNHGDTDLHFFRNFDHLHNSGFAVNDYLLVQNYLYNHLLCRNRAHRVCHFDLQQLL